jgi:hypothetical protein
MALHASLPPGPVAPRRRRPGARADALRHAHLNSIDLAKAIDFYTTRLSGEKAAFDGKDAVWTQKSWLLFTKVKQAPPHVELFGAGTRVRPPRCRSTT